MPIPSGPGDEPSLRRAVLAAAVLHDLDLRPTADGVELTGDRRVLVTWVDLALATSGHVGATARERVRALLLVRRAVAEHGAPRADGSGLPAVACAMPRGHALHPGPAWVRGSVHGGLLDVGVGVLVGAGALPLPLPPGPDAGVEDALLWPALLARLERAGGVAAARFGTGVRAGLVRPVAGHDVPTLLASAPVRAALAGLDGTGLRVLAVPARSRGWFDERYLDPAFVRAAWALTDEGERGVPWPVLVTRDEVSRARAPGGDDTATGS